MRHVLAAAGVIGAVFFAGGARASELTIHPGVAIGEIKLGMPLSQVKRVLGKDYILNDRATIAGAPYRELGWNFASWTVGFLRHGQTSRVVQVATSLRSQRTPAGIGPGTAWAKVVQTYRGGACTFGVRYGGAGPTAEYPEYMVGHRGGTQTIYKFGAARNASKLATVIEVTVRTPFRRLPEFGSNWSYRCADGWQDAASPTLRLRSP